MAQQKQEELEHSGALKSMNLWVLFCDSFGFLILVPILNSCFLEVLSLIFPPDPNETFLYERPGFKLWPKRTPTLIGLV